MSQNGSRGSSRHAPQMKRVHFFKPQCIRALVISTIAPIFKSFLGYTAIMRIAVLMLYQFCLFINYYFIEYLQVRYESSSVCFVYSLHYGTTLSS